MSSLCFEIFLFIHKIVFKKKLLLFGKKESGIIRIEIGCLVKRPFHQKRKKKWKFIRSDGCYGVIEMIIISKKAFPTVVYSIIKRN